MAYRIALHSVAATWNLLLMIWAWRNRKIDLAYSTLVPVYLSSGVYCASWALALALRSEFVMRFTWAGAFWPTATLIFVRRIIGPELTKPMARVLWLTATAVCLGGMSPWGLSHVQQYVPETIVRYGPLEPVLRIGLLVLTAMALSTAMQAIFLKYQELPRVELYLGIVFLIYGMSALCTAAILPLLGHYEWLESTSFGSIVWTTVAVCMAFAHIHKKNQVLSELDQYKKNLISHITHEFRTPLNVIDSSIGFLENANNHNAALVHTYAAVISRNAKRLGYLINDLLDLAAAQQSKLVLHPSELNLNDTINDAIEQIRPLAADFNVRLASKVPDYIVRADRERFFQVVNNLLSNGIKAARNGTVNISAAPANGGVSVTVQDNGIGLRSDQLNMIFDSFYQAQHRNASLKGSGLGLAVAKALVEAHGGKIWAESEGEGKGTTVRFTLPA